MPIRPRSGSLHVVRQRKSCSSSAALGCLKLTTSQPAGLTPDMTCRTRHPCRRRPYPGRSEATRECWTHSEAVAGNLTLEYVLQEAFDTASSTCKRALRSLATY